MTKLCGPVALSRTYVEDGPISARSHPFPTAPKT